MVVKLFFTHFILFVLFESSVISYGSQTSNSHAQRTSEFESSVISYGSQTGFCRKDRCGKFESSVISYGSQTNSKTGDVWTGLRVV